MHSLRSSNSGHHQNNIPPLESVHTDGNYHSSSGGDRLGREGNRSSEPYSMYVYQQWAKLNPEAAANVHPSAAADLFTRAVKGCNGISNRINFLQLHMLFKKLVIKLFLLLHQ